MGKETLHKVIYNWIDNQNYSYFEVGDNCSEIIEINREWCKAIDGDEITEFANINKKIFKKV